MVGDTGRSRLERLWEVGEPGTTQSVRLGSRSRSNSSWETESNVERGVEEQLGTNCIILVSPLCWSVTVLGMRLSQSQSHIITTLRCWSAGHKNTTGDDATGTIQSLPAELEP